VDGLGERKGTYIMSFPCVFSMQPTLEQFNHEMTRLGVRDTDAVVCYDTVGIFSSPRLWFMLQYFGHERVAVLDGGLPAYIAAGGAVEVSEPLPAAAADAADAADADADAGVLVPMRVLVLFCSTGGLVLVHAHGSPPPPPPPPALRSHSHHSHSHHPS
jgi:hypothetical protein